MSASNLANLEVALAQGSLVVRSTASSVFLLAQDPNNVDPDFFTTMRLNVTIDLLQNRPASWWRESTSLRNALIDDLLLVILPAPVVPPPPPPPPPTEGSATQTIRTVSANYTAQTDDYTLLVDAASGPVTITLPLASGQSGRLLIIKKIDSSSNPVTVAPQPPSTIDGDATYVLSIQWESISLHCNGQGYYVL